jgi:phosphoribosyl 1,2-cyclic phosphodiesterase
MSLELCILASGSSGNAAVVRTPAGVILIDLGIGPRTTARRLQGTGVKVADVAAACLTHLDSDHFSWRWGPTLVRHGVRVFCHAAKVGRLVATHAVQAEAGAGDAFARLVCPFDDAAFEILPGVRVAPIQLAHDRAGSHGFLIEGFGDRIGYATDLGRVPVHLIEHFRDCDVLAIESNYDPEMQANSGRPEFLKRRIMGGAGHLSNAQALAAVRQILDRSPGRWPDHVVLLHRSRECNCPQLLRREFGRDVRIAPRLVLAEPYARTEWLRRREVAPAAGEQLMLAFS